MFNSLLCILSKPKTGNPFNLIFGRLICTSKANFWNRNPGSRYPSKANHGARPDCRSLRKIRKRLKTGK
ncbi:hypothetical protein MACJ_004100 [Theileria orientalis]|uniref:Uncharacterized protein n=1 Tax=Theileria orientalis TaxID=68886 RepID=A0A976SL60_THEOR|nr:hypothetical protein MACJ_004100 [Theileria orientalis]